MKAKILRGLGVFVVLFLIGSVSVFADDVIVYTCYQGFNSRVYIMDMDGTKDSSTSYDGYVYGSTYLNDRLYTLTEDNLIQCWDISQWPDMILYPPSMITPPTPECRGLSHDGEHFWTAESKDQAGFIYCFNTEGTIITQINEPAYSGWGVCVAPNYPTALHRHTWASIKMSY
ncbi:MAG: hypothetical protein K8R76_07035 [Candidatus Aegiribacteria sp.]|nr:hypothetical protein [Candidatus Aegiribacteria sp.]